MIISCQTTSLFFLLHFESLDIIAHIVPFLYGKMHLEHAL
jgi:hypothetical protein